MRAGRADHHRTNHIKNTASFTHIIYLCFIEFNKMTNTKPYF
jgi:hypothetical protein